MTPEDRKSYAKALGPQQPGATWTNIPPMFSGRQVAGTSGTTGLGILGLGKYEMPDGSNQVSWGLAQPALDAYRSMRYGLGFEQDPNAPEGYVSEEAISRGAFGAAGAMATGGIAATTAAKAAGKAMVPDGALGSNASFRRHLRNVHGAIKDNEVVGAPRPRKLKSDETRVNSFVGNLNSKLGDADGFKSYVSSMIDDPSVSDDEIIAVAKIFAGGRAANREEALRSIGQERLRQSHARYKASTAAKSRTW